MLSYVDLGNRIREERKKKGLSQEQLAEITNLSITHVSHIETANTKVSLPVFVRIANALQVTADTLLCDSIECSSIVLNGKISELTEDCSEEELHVLTDILQIAKKSMHKYLSRKVYESNENVPGRNPWRQE